MAYGSIMSLALTLRAWEQEADLKMESIWTKVQFVCLLRKWTLVGLDLQSGQQDNSNWLGN